MKDCFKNRCCALLGAWDRFFFSPIPLLPLGMFRLVFGLCTFWMYAVRLKDWRFYFTDIGFVQSAEALEILPEFVRPAIALYPTQPSMVLGLHIVFLIALLMIAVGLYSRIVSILAFVLHLAFLQRNFSVAYGADIVTTFFLFGLAFTESDRVLSLRAWLCQKRAQKPMCPVSSLFTTMGVRLVQVQLCVIYGYTGLEKLKGASWWDGTAVWAVIGNQQIMTFDATWLRHLPLAIAFMTFSTVAFEVYFPVLVWIKPVRKWILYFGAVLHAMIALTVGLIFFSLAMVSTYCLFIDDTWLRSKLARYLPARLL